MNYTIPPKFEGDGRTKVRATLQPIGTNSMAVTKGQARRLIDALYATGRATHSGNGNMLWVTLEALHYNLTPYRLNCVPSAGWCVLIDRETS